MSIGQVRSRTMMGLIGASALGLSACFGGVVTDGAAGGGINGVDVDIRGCDTCPVESFTTATWSGLPGVYRSDPYAGVGDPVIVNQHPPGVLHSALVVDGDHSATVEEGGGHQGVQPAKPSMTGTMSSMSG